MKIGKFAENNGLTIETIRHYMELGLIIPEKVGGQYAFDSRCQESLEEILELKDMGFNLSEIKTIFFYKGFACSTSYKENINYKSIFLDKYKKVEREIETLTRVKEKLEVKIDSLKDIGKQTLEPIGIDLRALNLLSCKKCGKDLTLCNGTIMNNQVMDGVLKCSCGEEYIIDSGILVVGNANEETGFNNNFPVEYINETDSEYLENLHKDFEWIYRRVSNSKLNNKVMLELGSGAGFFLRNFYDVLPENCLYIAVDHSLERQKFLKMIFEKTKYKRNIIFICSDFLDIPIKKKSVDIVLDISGTTNYSFDNEEFLLDLINSYIKEDVELFGLYILFKNFSSKSLIEHKLRKNFILEKVKEKIERQNYKVIDEKVAPCIEKGGKYDTYFVEGEKVFTYCLQGKRLG